MMQISLPLVSHQDICVGFFKCGCCLALAENMGRPQGMNSFFQPAKNCASAASSSVSSILQAYKQVVGCWRILRLAWRRINQPLIKHKRQHKIILHLKFLHIAPEIPTLRLFHPLHLPNMTWQKIKVTKTHQNYLELGSMSQTTACWKHLYSLHSILIFTDRSWQVANPFPSTHVS